MSRALAGRLITGRGAFLVAGLVDLLGAIWWLKVRRRSWPENSDHDE